MSAVYRGKSGERVLVTGACGFIGSHLAEALVTQGYQVRAMTWYSPSGDRGWLERIAPAIRNEMEIIPGDIRDASCVRSAVEGCDAVLHLAALIGIPWSYVAPDSYVATNITGTLNVLQAVRDIGCRRVVHTSTSEVYGTPVTVPISETHPLQGQSPYSATKIAADQMAQAYFCSFDLPVVTLRPFNTFGPRQSTRAVIPAIITQLARHPESLRLGSLNPTRDFVPVADTVRGFIAALEAPKVEGQTIHLGTGHETSIGDLASCIASIMKVQCLIEEDSERLRPSKSEVQRLLADPSRAQELLGWRSSVFDAASFRAALEATVEWFHEPAHLDLYRSTSYAK